MACTREFAPGFSVSSGAHLLYQLDEQIIEELELEQHGLELSAESIDTVALRPWWQTHPNRGRHGHRRKTSADQDKASMTQYRERMLRFAGNHFRPA